MFLLQNSFPGSKHDENYYQPTVNTITPEDFNWGNSRREGLRKQKCRIFKGKKLNLWTSSILDLQVSMEVSWTHEITGDTQSLISYSNYIVCCKSWSQKQYLSHLLLFLSKRNTTELIPSLMPSRKRRCMRKKNNWETNWRSRRRRGSEQALNSFGLILKDGSLSLSFPLMLDTCSKRYLLYL